MLGIKKRGFGQGKWLGIGGKVEKDEIAERAAIREVTEEINVVPSRLKKMATLDFYFPHIKDESWNQRVIVFTCSTWKGTPKESAEMNPAWFKIKDLPYDKMWDDAVCWNPLLFQGKKFTAHFMFNKNLNVTEYQIKFL